MTDKTLPPMPDKYKSDPGPYFSSDEFRSVADRAAASIREAMTNPQPSLPHPTTDPSASRFRFDHPDFAPAGYDEPKFQTRLTLDGRVLESPPEHVHTAIEEESGGVVIRVFFRHNGSDHIAVIRYPGSGAGAAGRADADSPNISG
jgi:hypothetical protein